MDTATIETPLIAGTPFGGGILAGRYFIGAQAFALIVAPAGEGELAKTVWGGTKGVAGAGSYADGLANTMAMAEAGSKLAKWAQALRIDGHDDWYIPSRLESLLAFGELGDAKVFECDWYWTSTQFASNSGYAWVQGFTYGSQDHNHKGTKLRARAVRRLAL